MIFSKEKLLQESTDTGFRPEMLEKVLLLANLLQDYTIHPFLKNRIALKGGTALNLFYFDLPRLSVDIDLNYIGALDKETMLAERPEIESIIINIAQSKGFTLDRAPKRHAGGKLALQYPSVLGHKGNIAVDLNYMFRVPLMPIVFRDSCHIGSVQIKNIPVLNIHELAAGKLSALFDRTASRDLFDSYHLFKNCTIDSKILRPLFMIYGAMSQKSDWRHIKISNITVESRELKNRLLPVLNHRDIAQLQKSKNWAVSMVEECQKALTCLLPLTKQEIEFFDRLHAAEITPELICDNPQVANLIHLHPALQWRLTCLKTQQTYKT